MSQHDYVIANQTFPNTRTDLNNAFAAIVSQNAGASAPSTTYAYMLWYDTTNDLLKMRNADDDAWVDLFTVDQTGDTARANGVVNPSLIINGDMVIDQRNNGSTVTAHNSYPLDRFRISEVTTTGTFEASRSTEAPDGFTNSLLFKVKTTDTSIGAEYAGIRYKVEGYDMAHLNFGTSAAKTITLSFYVKFSVAGTYGGAIGNGSNRTYPFSYTVNTADTWERKTITIEGSTSGTFASDNAVGFELWLLSIGGTTFGNEAAGAWVDSYEISPTGVTNFYATDESTYYITGVKLEVGSTATPFVHESYGDNLRKCQRYYHDPNFVSSSTLDGNRILIEAFGSGGLGSFNFPVTMRAQPSITIFGQKNSQQGNIRVSGTGLFVGGGNAVASNISGSGFGFVSGMSGLLVSDEVYDCTYKADAEL